MSELISREEAKLAWANGFTVQVDIGSGVFGDITNDDLLRVFDYTTNKFRLKPCNVKINGISIPAPFEPKEDEDYFFIANGRKGYSSTHECSPALFFYGAWRSECEIKQVVAALRKVFKGE